MASPELIKAVNGYQEHIKRHGLSEEAIDALIMAADTAINSEHDLEYGLKVSKLAKAAVDSFVRRRTGGGSIFDLDSYCNLNRTTYDIRELWYRALRVEAPHLFESYLLYLERNRNEEAKFYFPKMRQLNRHGIIQAMQDLEDDKINRLCLSLPPGTQKTTCEKFFCTWVIGRHIDDYSIFFSHSDDITRMFYKGALDIMTSDEYTFNEIFPECVLQATDAKAETINFGKYKPFASLQCSSIGAKNAGKIRANRYLYLDDLIGKLEEALNPNTLEKIWNIYSVDLRQRKLNEQVKELIIATRWSVRDVIGRVQALYDGDPKMRVIAVPDIDPVTGKSNFDYKYNGMSVAFFEDQALAMDDISYRCLYKQEPIEREGLLYHDEDLMRYLSLPGVEPDAVLAVCDVKNKGGDDMFLPVFLQFGEKHYLVDCICDDNADFGIQEKRCSAILLKYNVQQCRFESNNGGDRFAANVNAMVEEQKGRCNVTTKFTESNKETKIIVNADWVKKHVVFPDKALYAPKSDMGKAMGMLLTYAVTGKNAHDDVPDGLAQYALMVTEDRSYARAEAIKNPFSGWWYG